MLYLFKPNTIYCGENLKVLKNFPKECVDLIYIDPPFFTSKNYEIIWGDKQEKRYFEDVWNVGIRSYKDFMYERVFELHRILKPTGSFYLHCDYHANAHLRIMCDKIFGKKNFRNEIVWKRVTASKSHSKNSFGVVNDTILYYTKSNNYVFNLQTNPLTTDQINKLYNNVEEETGRRFKSSNLLMGGNKGNKILVFVDKGTINAKDGYHYSWNQGYYDKKIEENPFCIYWTKNGNPRYKKYLDEHKGIPLNNVWDDIFPIGSISSERLGYPTQKPEALLERIIKVSSNEEDLVLDAFCGCGTTLAVAKKLNRRFIGIDFSYTACEIIANRISYNIGDVLGMPVSIEDVKKMRPFEFQEWCIRRFGGINNPKKSGDMGIDGWKDGIPIQVKQSNIGSPHIKMFITTIQMDNKSSGYIIGFGISKGAKEDIVWAKQKNINIKFVPVSSLLTFYNKNK